MRIVSDLLAAALLSTSLATPAWAAIPWDGSPFFLTTRGSKLANVLRDFGANYDIPVIVSDRITESFIGSLGNMTPEQTLDHLARLYKLAWYYDGQTIHVYKAQDVSSRLVTPSYLPAETLIGQLRHTGLLHRRYCRLRAVPSSNAVEIQGVPSCLDRVSQLARQLDEQKLNHEQNQEAVQIFPLKYASATDNDYSFRDHPVRVPGVTSVLREMTQGRTLPLPQNTQPSTPANHDLPMFSADPRQNAVIVRDRKINMPLYADLIRQLDQRPSLIEISVAIIDVNAEDLNALGIDWSASARLGGGTVSFNSGGDMDAGGFSTVVSNTGNFMVRLNALEQNARARILSRPSVVTLSNIQAVLDRNITFNTKLVGEKTAKIESISTGSLLRVTPRLITERGQSEVMLTLNIQDGRQDEPFSAAEPLPQTRNSEISTQAMLKAGQSLLLGGFVQNEHLENERKIPLLGDIPVLGKLFTSTRATSRSVVRLFLIKAEPSIES